MRTLGDDFAFGTTTLGRQRPDAGPHADPHVPSLVLEHGHTMKAVELTKPRMAAADCVVIVTDHVDFDYRKIVDTAQLVVDTRNATWGLDVPRERVVTL